MGKRNCNNNAQGDSSRLVKNTTIYAVGDIIPKLLSFVVFPVLTSYLSPKDYGIINYVNTLNVFLSILGLLCLNTYYLVFYYRQDSEEARQRLLGNLSLFVIGLNVAGSLLLCLLGSLFPHLFSNKIDFYPYIFIGIITNLSGILIIFPSALYRVKENPFPLTVLNVLKGVLTTLCTVILVVGYGYKALGVLFSSMVISVFFGIIFIALTWRETVWNINWRQLRMAFAFSLPLIPGSIAYYLMSMSDRFFIERYLDLTQLGIYSTASTLAMVLNVITYGSYKAFEPYIFKIYGTDGFESKFNKMRNYFLAVILVGSAGLSIFARDFFRIFASEQYQTVYFYVPFVEMSVVFASFSMLYSTVLTAQGKTKRNSLFTMIGGGLSIIINLLLMPHIGLLSACLASILSFGVIMMLSLINSKLYQGMKRVFAVFLLISTLVAVSVYFIRIENVLLSVAVRSLILVMIFLIILRSFKMNVIDILYNLKKDEKNYQINN